MQCEYPDQSSARIQRECLATLAKVEQVLPAFSPRPEVPDLGSYDAVN